MAFTLTSNKGTGTTSAGSAPIGTAQGKGNLIVVGSGNVSSGTATISSITDTVGTSYSNLRLGVNSFGESYLLCWGFLGGTGSNSITITWSAGAMGNVVYAEFSGSSVTGATQDGTGQSADANSATITAPSITTVGTDDLVLNYILADNGGIAVSGWSTAVSGGFNGFLAYQADVGAGTYTANATCTSGKWGSLIIALKAPAAAATAQPLVVGQMMRRASYF